MLLFGKNEGNVRYKIDLGAQTFGGRKRGKEGKIVQKTGDGFGVAEFSALNHLFQLGASEGARNDFLVHLGPRISTGKFLSEENIHSFLKKSRRRKNVQENAEMFGAKPRFFDEFAGGGPAGVFSLLYAASHQFPEELSGGMAVLAEKKDAAVRQEGQDNYGPGMGDDFTSGADAPG